MDLHIIRVSRIIFKIYGSEKSMVVLACSHQAKTKELGVQDQPSPRKTNKPNQTQTKKKRHTYSYKGNITLWKVPIWSYYFFDLALDRLTVLKKNIETHDFPTDALEVPCDPSSGLQTELALVNPQSFRYLGTLLRFAFSGHQKSLIASLSDAFRAPISFPSQQITQPMVESLTNSLGV